MKRRNWREGEIGGFAGEKERRRTATWKETQKDELVRAREEERERDRNEDGEVSERERIGISAAQMKPLCPCL